MLLKSRTHCAQVQLNCFTHLTATLAMLRVALHLNYYFYFYNTITTITNTVVACARALVLKTLGRLATAPSVCESTCSVCESTSSVCESTSTVCESTSYSRSPGNHPIPNIGTGY
jgi:hypothetical protein